MENHMYLPFAIIHLRPFIMSESCCALSLIVTYVNDLPYLHAKLMSRFRNKSRTILFAQLFRCGKS